MSTFASFDVAVGLLLAAGLAVAVKPAAPASFRRTVIASVAVVAAAVGVIAVLRALVTIIYGHAFGVGGFVQSLAAVPVAAVAAGLAVAGARSPAS